MKKGVKEIIKPVSRTSVWCICDSYLNNLLISRYVINDIESYIMCREKWCKRMERMIYYYNRIIV